MGGVLNDWGCDACGQESRNRVLPSGEVPSCRCGEAMVCLWDHGQAPTTDLHGPEFSHATGMWHRSTREAEMVLAQQARDWSDRTGMRFMRPISAGDKVHGAREETAQTGRIYGYAGQRGRSSMGERPARREAPVEVRQPPALSRYAVNGVTPRRMGREEAMRERRARTYGGA